MATSGSLGYLPSSLSVLGRGFFAIRMWGSSAAEAYPPAVARGKKLWLYASCAVPEYWVTKLPDRCIEVFTQPTPGAYGKVERY